MKSSGLLLVLLLSVLTSAQDLFNFHAGDKYQYIAVREEQQVIFMRETWYYRNVITTTEFQGKTFYKIRICDNVGWYRYDTTEQKLFILVNQEEKLAFDFTQPAGTIQQLYLRGGPYNYKYLAESTTILFGQNLREFAVIPQDSEQGYHRISLVEKYGFRERHYHLDMGGGDYRDYIMFPIAAIVDSVEYGRFNINLSPVFPQLTRENPEYTIYSGLQHPFRELINLLKADILLYQGDSVIYSNTYNGNKTTGNIPVTIPVNMLSYADSAGLKITCTDTSIFSNSRIFPAEGYHILRFEGSLPWNLILPQITEPGYRILSGMNFFTPSTGYISFLLPVIGYPPSVSVHKTTNGGTTFLQSELNTTNSSIEIMVIDQDYGYKILGSLFKTTNSGVSWTQLSLPNNPLVRKISFINRDTGWVSCIESETYKLYRTLNGGNSFELLTILPQESVSSICFENSIKGYILTNSGKLYTSADSGFTWVLAGTQFSGYENIKMFNGGKGWITGPNLLRTIDGGVTLTMMLPGTITHAYFFDENIAWVITDNYLKYTGDGGLTWSNHINPDPANPLKFVDFIDREHGWAITHKDNNSRLYRTTNGGLIFIEDEEFGNSDNNYSMYQNYPNPFNPTTMIRYTLPSRQHVAIKVYDIMGKEVALLVNEEMEKGNHETEFNAGRLNLSSGIYFYNISGPDFSETRKMVYLK